MNMTTSEVSLDLSAKAATWSIYAMVLFRFAFAFIISFIVFLDWSVNPVLPWLYYEGGMAEFLDMIITWVARNIFDIHYTIISPYDGQHNDRIYIYLLYLVMATFSVFVTIIWSTLDARRSNYVVLHYWLTTIVRYYLAFTLFVFALEKFFKAQFPDLGLYTLTQPVGDMSPMGLAWAFFGHSYGYNVFMGLAESAALLLLFRRTMIFGAILTLIALSNVIAVNFSYDVHAKIYPVALAAMALFLLVPSADRLFRFFFTDQSTSLPFLNAPVSGKRWMNRSRAVLKVLLITSFIGYSISDYVDYARSRQNREVQKSALGISGIYDVETQLVNGDTLTPGNQSRWNQIILGDRRERIRLNGDSIAFIELLADRREMFVYFDRFTLEKNEQEILDEHGLNESTYAKIDSMLFARQVKSRMEFEFIDSTTIRLKGQIRGDSVFMIARKRLVAAQNFRLNRTGFHWVTESVTVY